jgi:hypothetical protein
LCSYQSSLIEAVFQGNTSVTNIEYHGKPFSGTRERITLENFYETTWTNPTTGVKRTYKHVGNVFEELSNNENFDLLVKQAQEAQLSEEIETTEQTPALKSVC